MKLSADLERYFAMSLLNLSAMVAAVVVPILLPQVSATLIAKHEFSGHQGTPLDGRLSDIGGGTWVAGPAFFASGAVSPTTEASRNCATLPVTLDPGWIYTLTAKFKVSSESPGHFAAGFTAGGSRGEADFDSESVEGVAWVQFYDITSSGLSLLRQDDSKATQTSIPADLTATSIETKIILDTTQAAGWKVAFDFRNDGVIDWSGVIAAGTPISAIGFSTQGERAEIKSMILRIDTGKPYKSPNFPDLYKFWETFDEDPNWATEYPEFFRWDGIQQALFVQIQPSLLEGGSPVNCATSLGDC